MSEKMEIDLVFYDWIKPEGGSARYSEIRTELSLGDFHGGTTFKAEIELENYRDEFKIAAEEGIVPLFYAQEAKEALGEYSIEILRIMDRHTEMLRIATRHIDDATDASIAFQAGVITIGECLAIINLAIDWCKFVEELEAAHGPSDS